MQLNNYKIQKKKEQLKDLIKNSKKQLDEKVLAELNEREISYEVSRFFRDMKYIVLPMGVALMSFAGITGILDKSLLLTVAGFASAGFIYYAGSKEITAYKKEKGYDKKASLDKIVADKGKEYNKLMDDAIEILR